MKYKIRVNDNEYLLDSSQVEQLYELLENTTLLYEENVGENAGYVGWKKSYIYSFDKTIRDIDFCPKGMLSDSQLQTYQELWRLRKESSNDASS
jgi:hypothetical protein